MEVFISDKPIEIEISGIKFKIKEVSGDEFDRITNSYIKVIDENKFDIDIAKKNIEWLKTVVDMNLVQMNKKFSEMNQDERIKTLQRLKPSIRNALLREIAKINELPEDIKKK